jgi:hypothetical protein
LEHLDHSVLQTFVDPHPKVSADTRRRERAAAHGHTQTTLLGSAAHETHTSDEVYTAHDPMAASSSSALAAVKRAAPCAVVYRYHFRLIETSDRVTEVIERFLHTHHRRITNAEDEANHAQQQQAAGAGGVKPNDPHHAEAQYQVDADELSALLHSMVVDLGLDRAYNMFVLAPHRYVSAALPNARQRIGRLF